jgi:outer membrane protein OmpA-like peptidoglycan-associated protein
MKPVRGFRPTRAQSKLLRAVDPRYLEELQSLRKLFVEPEQTRLEHLEQPLSPEVVGGLLPEAIAHASQIRREGLTVAIGRPVTDALRDVARREPELFCELLAPTIGTAVRRAVTDALSAILERVNRVIDRSLSLRSLAWRLEAMRTGRSFAEVVIAHTLLYRVEWVVLIHTETSLVLAQATVPGVPQAPDQTSAMLQAISAFVRDAFKPAIPGADLQTIEVGDLNVWIDRDPAMTLAAAIRGAAPDELRETFRQTLEQVRTLHHAEIADRYPDTSKFADVHPLLADCLQQRFKPTRKQAQWILAGLAVAAVVIAAVALVRADAAERRDVALRAAYRAALSAAPGIVVTSIARADHGYRIEGLRDPRAAPADEIIAAAGLPTASLALAPFDSLDPRFEGPLAAADAAIRELEAIEISFERGMTDVRPAERAAIERAAQLVNRAQRAAVRAHVGLCVEVVGNADETGTAAVNEVVRSARADSVARALRLAGAPPELLALRVTDAMTSRPDRQVTFRAALRPSPDRSGCPP